MDPAKAKESGKEWFVTGWGEKNCWTPKDVWEAYGSHIQCVKGGIEIGPEKGGEHWHVCIQWKTRTFRSTVASRLKGHFSWWDPMYERSTWEKMTNYACKDGSFQVYGEWKQSRADQDKKSKVARKRLFEEIQNGMSYADCWHNHADTMAHYYRAAKEYISVLGIEENSADYKIDTFLREPITDWSKSIILRGPPNTGKTQYALAHFKFPLFVSDLNDLSMYQRDKHDGIVFDDMEFRSESRERQIALLDQDQPRSIRVLYQAVRIPKRTKKIFTTNVDDIFNWDDVAIDRRARIIDIAAGDLYVRDNPTELSES